MYQSTTIIGRLGKDVEMRYLPNGDPVANFNIATDRVYNDRNGQKQSETTWFKIAVFGKTAENCNNFLSKGKLVLVEGRIKTPEIYNKQDGTQGTSLELVANTVRFLSPKDAESMSASSGDES